MFDLDTLAEFDRLAAWAPAAPERAAPVQRPASPLGPVVMTDVATCPATRSVGDRCPFFYGGAG